VDDIRKTFDELEGTLGYRLEMTLAYYPDGRQEQLLGQYGLMDVVDYAHTMAYDAPGPNHSPIALAHQVIHNARTHSLPLHKITLGVPFYGRNVVTGDWKTYEDIIGSQKEKALRANEVVMGSETIGYNCPDMIREKTALSVAAGLGGVMVWEVGQDCRIEQVVRGDKIHHVTCPDTEWSLLEAIDRTLRDEIGEDWRGWVTPQFLRPKEDDSPRDVKAKDEL
jgi:GH18 family chitinase